MPLSRELSYTRGAAWCVPSEMSSYPESTASSLLLQTGKRKFALASHCRVAARELGERHGCKTAANARQSVDSRKTTAGAAMLPALSSRLAICKDPPESVRKGLAACSPCWQEGHSAAGYSQGTASGKVTSNLTYNRLLLFCVCTIYANRVSAAREPQEQGCLMQG